MQNYAKLCKIMQNYANVQILYNEDKNDLEI
jgi:hypothetical protein